MANELKTAEQFPAKATPGANDQVPYWDFTAKKLVKFSFTQFTAWLKELLYTKSEIDDKLTSLSGSAETFDADFTVKLGPGEKFLKWYTDEVLPAAGKTPKQVMLEGSKKVFPATYSAPTASLS